MARLKVSIQAPGRGSQPATAGIRLAARYGRAMPTPMLAKISKACTAGKPSARPRDAPMKGAVQGDAMATASMPDKNAFAAGLRASSVATRLGKNWPNSNKPARFKPITVNNVAKPATTRGDCN